MHKIPTYLIVCYLQLMDFVSFLLGYDGNRRKHHRHLTMEAKAFRVEISRHGTGQPVDFEKILKQKQ